MGAVNKAIQAITDAAFDRRMQNWAQWCQNGRRGALMGYTSPWVGNMMGGCREASSSAPVGMALSDDQEQEVERFVMCLAAQDLAAAEVLRAEYKAHPRFGDANGPFTGEQTRERSCRQLKISDRTYRAKLQVAKTAVRSMMMLGAPIRAVPVRAQNSAKW